MDDRTLIEPMDKTVFEAAIEPDRGPVQGWLTIWSGPLRGRDFPLYPGPNLIGSDSHCQIPLSIPGFPRFALNIRIEEKRWLSIDIDSADGFLHNREQTIRCELADDDWLETAGLRIRVKKR